MVVFFINTIIIKTAKSIDWQYIYFNFFWQKSRGKMKSFAVFLNDVNILLPLGTSDPPAIESIDGVYKHDPSSGMMCWHFDQVSAANNSTGSLEFSIAGNNPDVFFPVHIGFRSETLLCNLEIASILNSTTGAPIPNQITKSFIPDSYQCS